MEFNLADLFEHSADQFPERECLVAEGARRTYAQMDARANQLAHFLLAQGVRPGEHVGIYAYNSVEWVEALWAIFKIRAVWININYRYVEDELRYLFGNADLVGPDLPARVRAAHPRRARRACPGCASRWRSRTRATPTPPVSTRTTTSRRWAPARRCATSTSARPTTATSSTRAAPPACPRAWSGGTRTC